MTLHIGCVRHDNGRYKPVLVGVDVGMYIGPGTFPHPVLALRAAERALAAKAYASWWFAPLGNEIFSTAEMVARCRKGERDGG